MNIIDTFSFFGVVWNFLGVFFVKVIQKTYNVIVVVLFLLYSFGDKIRISFRFFYLWYIFAKVNFICICSSLIYPCWYLLSFKSGFNFITVVVIAYVVRWNIYYVYTCCGHITSVVALMIIIWIWDKYEYFHILK